MPWAAPPYPPGFETPGIGYLLVIGGITLCFMGMVICAVVRAKADFSQPDSPVPPPLAPPDTQESPGGQVGTAGPPTRGNGSGAGDGKAQKS